MLRANKRLAILGAVYQADILAMPYYSLKWYWFSKIWSKISPETSTQKALLPFKFIFLTKNCHFAWLENEWDWIWYINFFMNN